ncbi:MAG: hypothetical protein PHG03_06240, partial [Bacilli bacterium]|nr:hypothetical protein [Bacilli bacterium]MDD4796126.1 hypothetical protein [Bacilli bacterium]
MNKKNIIVPAVLGIILLLIITIGLSFAYFTANITGGEETTTITVKGGKMLITFNGGSEVDVDNIAPSNTPFGTKTFTVTGFNNTNIPMGYKISLVVESNTFSENAIQYKMISTNNDNSGNVATSINVLTNIRTGDGIYTLGYGNFKVPTDNNKTHTYNLELYFPNEEYDQNENQGKQIKAHVLVENFDYNDIPYDETKGVNKPVLFAGMTPVKWDDEFKEIETTEEDSSWYDYNAKKWANAKTEDDSYWVWIPR